MVVALDFSWLRRNIQESWRSKATGLDFLRQLLWTYSSKFPKWLRCDEWVIGFRYAAPIGRIRLLLRTNGGADRFIHSELFEHRYYDLPLASPPATILDLGANIGLSAVYFSRRYPEAHLACVEPVPGNLRLLKRNLELNGVRGTIFAAAVDAHDGKATIALDTNDYGHKIADARSSVSGPKIEVEAITVSTIRRRLGWDRIGLLKVDIEGHEKALFNGKCDWLNYVDAICIECHEGFGESDLNRLASQFGFAPPQRLPGIWFMNRTAI